MNYYDYKGRTNQTFAQNHFGGIDRTDYQYRFNNEVLIMRMEHLGINEIYNYNYDHLGRKTAFKHTLNGTLKNVAKYDYDQIGRLKTKKLSPTNDIGTQASGDWNNTNVWLNGSVPSVNDHVFINETHTITIPNGQAGSAGSLFLGGILNNYGRLDLGKLPSTFGESDLQTVDYSYHIRGGISGINLDASGNLTNKLFSMRLGYEDAGFFDGNIGKQEWKSSLDGQERSFTFSFDGASRILGASYSGSGSENYSLSNISYDANGNLLSLNRKGKTGTNSWGDIDQLSYVYQPYSNKIQAVNDALLVSNPNVGDFRDSSVIFTQYTYNQDGSLNSDDNKRIVFEWNYLKKPKKITKANGQWEKFMYDAEGTLLQTLTSTGKKIDFVGNLTYENDVLFQISHDEGRVINGNYEYDISDHAGNLRLSFKDSLGIAKIVTKLDYDPWGFRLKGLDYYNSSTYDKFKTFSGKELHEDFGFNLLSYKFRFHDPALGRFISIDPLAEKYNYNSTFAFAENKLGLGVEYEGLEMAPFEQMHSRQVIEQNKKVMTPQQAQNYEAHGNKVATVFVGGALSAGIGVATLPTTALVGAATGSGISGSLTVAGGGTKSEIMNSVVTGGIAGAITGGGSTVATKLGGSESIKVALNAASGYIAGATESAVSQKLNDGKVNSGDVVRAATVSSIFTTAGGKFGNLIDDVVNKVLTNTTVQQFGKEATNLFKEAFLSKTSNDINDKIKIKKK